MVCVEIDVEIFSNHNFFGREEPTAAEEKGEEKKRENKNKNREWKNKQEVKASLLPFE
jgi:hypothetical protein